ncbi:hypothetical protein ACHAXA_006892, partial [Cyclostephanos tholiformis]
YANERDVVDQSTMSSSSWFEEDDEALLSRLLLPPPCDSDDGDDQDDDLDACLDRLRVRLTHDVRRAVSDGWWEGLVGVASDFGFATIATLPTVNTPPVIDVEDEREEASFPRAFDSTGGRVHVRALTDLLGLGRGRAVRLTLASLRSFATARRGTARTNSALPREDEGDYDDDDDERESLRLRSLLGTGELFRRRGLFRLLLRLSCGPALSGMGASGSPRSVDDLRGGASVVGGILEGGDDCLLAVRSAAAEAMSVLLYERIDGGATRRDMFMIAHAASCCDSFEFGKAPSSPTTRRSKRGAGGGRSSSTYPSPGSSDADLTRCRLDGLWALICAGSVGLWRTGVGVSDGGDWVANHPLLAGINAPDADGRGRRARDELEALCLKLSTLGERARDRRGAAYVARDFDSEDDDDGELWGVRAPEAIALLSLGLLLRLAGLQRPQDEFFTKLDGWGEKYAQIANDECGAFAYLYRVMESMVQDPLVGNSLKKRRIGIDALVSNMLKRGEFEMAIHGKLLALEENGEKSDDWVVSDAASVVHASIGREILSGTIRVFRDELLSLQSHSSAVDNIGMLSDLASMIYRNSRILCEQFWSDWDVFCQQESDGVGNENGGIIDGGEPICYLLDASHSMAVMTLVELKTKGPQQAVIHYLKPLSTFLCLIASLCAVPSTVKSILTSEFLPEGLLESVMSVLVALAPLVSSLNKTHGQVSAEDRSTVRCATAAIQSISTLAYLGGEEAKDWIRKSLQSPAAASGGPRMIWHIASNVLPYTQNALENECAKHTASALNLLVDLLEGADAAFQINVCACLTPANRNSFRTDDATSGFSSFVASGSGSEITLASMTILNCFASQLIRNVFHPRIASSGTVHDYIATVGGGVLVALDVLSTFVSCGEISFPTFKVQVATAHVILSSVMATLVSLKQIIYLHEDDDVRGLALITRNDIIGALSSSTPLGQVVAFLATAPTSLTLIKNTLSLSELSQAMDSAAVQYLENKQDTTYGAWGKFVTPKRACQRASARRFNENSAEHSDDLFRNVQDDADSDLIDVGINALSLLLVWGQHAEDMAKSLPDQSLLRFSPCMLLLSKASPTSLQPHSAHITLNIANLNLISRLVNFADDGLGLKSALLSTKIIKMCVKHACVAKDISLDIARSLGFIDLRVALGGGSHIFNVLLCTLDKLICDGSSQSYLHGTEQQVLMASILLETIAVSVSAQPDLAKLILLGDEKQENWRLLDKISLCIVGTIDIMYNPSEDEESGRYDSLLVLRCLLTCSCLKVISELWTCCRLTCNHNYKSDSVHACGTVTSYLANASSSGSTSLVGSIVDLSRALLLAIMSLKEKSSMQDEVSTAVINRKGVLLDLLTLSLDIISVETNVRLRDNSKGGTKFVEDLVDSEPMKCWKVLLASGDAAASAATAWLKYSSNWNVSSFLHANPPEEDIPTSSWCSFGSALGLTKAILLNDVDSADSFIRCNALHTLARSGASFSSTWAIFVEVVTANMIATRPSNEVYALTTTLAETTIASLASISESKMISESLLSSRGFLFESGDTKPLGELCSLLLFSITAWRDFATADSAPIIPRNVFEMMRVLYESASKIFATTQLGSVAPSNQMVVCLIRLRLLTSALVLISAFESSEIPHDDMTAYNHLRIGFVDLAVKALQSLQYGNKNEPDDHAVDAELTEHGFAHAKYGYTFDATPENIDADSSFQLLRASLSLLLRLAPTMLGSTSNMGLYHRYTFGVDFAACLKESNAIHSLQYHLGAASNVASLTYDIVYAGAPTWPVAIIHNNAVDIVHSITVFFRTLTDSGSMVVDILLLLLENRCFGSLIDIPLWKISKKKWMSSSPDEAISTVARHRGYYTNFSMQGGNASSSRKKRPLWQKDSVHSIWREVISIFSSLMRSVKCQAETYAKVDEQIMRQLNQVYSVVLNFLCTYEDELFSCFLSMSSEARSQVILAGGKTKSSSFSSIKPSSFAFTPNLIKEAADVSSLFAELCKGDSKITLSNQCSGIYRRLLATSLELAKIMSLFLGSIGNARELFLALSSANAILAPSAMFDHPMLAEGIPNARHEAIRNAHFAHSCCILATVQDFADSHIATTKAVESAVGKDASLEKSFQIFVNNKLIVEVEWVAGQCLLNALSVLADSHPASDSFIFFTHEEFARLDVASVIRPGTTVALCPQMQFRRYCINQNVGAVQYARTIDCDRSTRTISVEYAESGLVAQNVPWSSIIGVEDVSKMQFVFSYGPSPTSIGDTDNHDQTSLGHLILALNWCRHVASVSSTDNVNKCSRNLIKCVVERAVSLLCTEVLLYDDMRDKEFYDDNISRKLNMQLLDLFEFMDTKSTSRCTPPRIKSLASVMDEDKLESVRRNLKHHLQAAACLREEEQKLWRLNNAGWDSTSFWGNSSTKRQGRRSPFRLTRSSSVEFPKP